jgi:hypothetical protein
MDRRAACPHVLKAAGVEPFGAFTGHYGADPHLSGDQSSAALSRGVPIKKAMDARTISSSGRSMANRCR